MEYIGNRQRAKEGLSKEQMKRIASKCSNEKKLDNKHILKTQKYWRGKRTQGWKKTKNKLIKKESINTRI